MKSSVLALMSILLLLALPSAAPAAPLKTYLSEFTVAGAPGKDELKTALPGILASRLNPERVQLVESRDVAEVLIAGSYAMFGKLFSVDVLIRNMASGKLTKVFEQGDGQDDLLPAMGRLALKIDGVLSTAPSAPVPTASPALPASAKPAAATPPPAPAAAAAPAESYLVKQLPSVSTAGNWSSPPLEGVFSGIALGRTLANGERELFVAGERSLRYYRQGKELRQIAEVVIPRPAKILAIDSADLDGDGIPEIYVTVMDRETLTSQVYVPKDAGLEKVAGNLPYFFRGIGPEPRSRKILVQELDAAGDFFDGVTELIKTGARFETRDRQKLPRNVALFNFNRFSDGSGTVYHVVLDGNGHLAVSSLDGLELWQSSDNFGGSEKFFTRESMSQARATGGDQYLWTFLQQRIIVTPDGKLLVPHNEGLLSVGNNRSYTKHTLHAFAWSGSSLKELWHTKPDSNYLADFAFDPTVGEMILLEVVRKESMFNKGATVISTHKID